ncbi:T9SS type A sorting domain-containing protein [Ferruginibacter albus]|uniref:T9SS type A sorting domain-containing protein n=1 Tax=Ferruginibacter albus TaxID=2875540 RepID=UPI001CC34DF9|nr:T9SS type A sorting domain-containing protein [Ferruginibacter albus]UAY51259.1 T9SS type A sorting domain-containing protein [Ferruginibacter albus]
MFFAAQVSAQSLFISRLYKVNADNSTSQLDYNQVYFNDSYSMSPIIGEDAPKLANINETFSVVESGTSLFSDRRPTLRQNDTIYFKLLRTLQQQYQLRFFPNMLSVGKTAFLKDNYTGNLTPVALSDSTVVNFLVNSNAASQAADRFKILFNTETVLPLSFIDVRAKQTSASTIKLQWSVISQSSIKEYAIERSLDGRSFGKIAFIPSLPNKAVLQYNWTDDDPAEGNNYYRISGIDNNNKISYTPIVNVTMEGSMATIMIYPNPVSGNVIGLKFENMPKGSYVMRLINNSGQEVSTQEIDHNGNNSYQTIRVGDLSKGLYNLEITGNDNFKKSLKVIK